VLPGGSSVAKILVADDNSNIQKMVGLALKDQGIDVVAVGNGEAAVRKISDVKPDLVLADVFMPVRNGYEVCRYVKEDSSLAHIPVILLVGAFDPLDEQEAQRVGADGVLKKPFVPPDPLISMVKSALTRAGVSLGPAPAQKPAPPPSRSTADILSGNVGSRTATLAPERVPEVTPEPVEEFATPREQVKIAAGQEPVAFGNLLQTNEEEDVAVFSSKPMIEIAKAKEWDEESKDVPEEEEEADASPRGGWRPGGLGKELQLSAKSTQDVPDWRDEAFHGNSPAKRNGSEQWAAAPVPSQIADAAETKVVAVTTLEARPADSPTPFSGDAWAAAMAAGIEEKLAQQAQPEVLVPEPKPAAELHADLPAELPGTVAASLNATTASPEAIVEEAKAAEPANWAPVPESTWEAEAKRASMLASTWDAPVPAASSSEETQEISVCSPEQPEVRGASRLEEAWSAPLGHDQAVSEPGASITLPAIDTSAEVAVEPTRSNNWENTWEAAKPLETPEAVVEHCKTPAETPAETSALSSPESNSQPNMDELVARVLGKMSPEVLQKVTHEILKPVIEAIVRDELNSKKS
jgi:CheY-like chemotaxis protein